MPWPPTRLDPLVRWKARELEQAKLALGERRQALAAARARLAEQARVLDAAPRDSAGAAHWELRDRAAAAGRAALLALAQEVEGAEAQLATAQAACWQANREAELFGRASERQRARLVQDIERRERRSLDELALLLRDR